MPRAVVVPSLILWCLSCSLVAQDAAPATVTLSGRVVNWQGQPIAGAGVAWVAREALTTAQLLAEPPVRTGADGRFTLTLPQAPESDELALPSLQIAAKGMAAIAPSVAWKYRPPAPGTERLRENTDAGDFVLPEGARLFGRVRDNEGKGVAGVVVTMRDLLDGHRAFGGTPSNAHCRATTNASGIFELPAALANGAVVDFAAKGFHRQLLHAVGAGAPLEVTLQPSGRIAGRVVDQKGGIVAGAIVRATYERSGTTTGARAGADGAFELSIEQPGRFRVRASRPRPPVAPGPNRRPPPETAESPLLDGPTASLELTLAVAKTPGAGTLRVQVVDAASGKPVTGFRAAAIWQPYALQNSAYLEYLAAMQQDTAPADSNELALKGPGEGEARTGAVRVTAPGYAPATERDVEWVEPDDKGDDKVDDGKPADGKTADVRAAEPRATDAKATDAKAPDANAPAGKTDTKPVVVKLVPEATIAGRVVDDRTGAPVAGASVWAARKQDRSQGSFGSPTDVPESAVQTAADGSFRLAQLGEGDWTLRFKHRERPLPPSIDVTLKAEEQKAGVDLKVAGGARVAGRITGLPIPAGSKVLLQPVAEPRFGSVQYWQNPGNRENDLRTPLAADGAFAFTGVALASFYLVVEMPSGPRGGGALYVPIEPLRVRPEGVQRDFDGGLDVPGRLHGTLQFPRAVPIGAVLVVVAEQLNESPDAMVYSSQQQLQGPRAFVQEDGSFTLPLVRGTHQLRVVDAATGVLLATSSERLPMPAGGELTREFKVPLTEFAVQLQPEGTAGPLVWVDRLEVRHQPPKADQNGMVVMGGGNDEYDFGFGLPVPAGTTTLKLWLPEGKATLFARSSAGNLRTGKERGRLQPLAKEEVEIAADDKAKREVVLKIGPPPELEAPAPKADGEQAVQKKGP